METIPTSGVIVPPEGSDDMMIRKTTAAMSSTTSMPTSSRDVSPGMPLARISCPTIAVLVTLAANENTSVSARFMPQDVGAEEGDEERQAHLEERKRAGPTNHLRELDRVELETDQEEKNNYPDVGDVTDHGRVGDPSQDVGPYDHPCENLGRDYRKAEAREEKSKGKGDGRKDSEA